jgi:uncharacterized protein DUF6580
MQQFPQNRLLTPRSGVLAAMIVFAVAMRLVIFYVPNALPYNFTPVEAIALFGGAYFTDRRLAFIVPIAAMFLADLIIGLHSLIPVVYGCILLTALLGMNLRGHVRPLPVAGYAFASAVMFFVITNFFVWLTGDMYPHDGAGLIACYVAGIPFFKGTLAGTLLWSAVLFGGFELMKRRWTSLEVAAA